jgi:hypothetical protein
MYAVPLCRSIEVLTNRLPLLLCYAMGVFMRLATGVSTVPTQHVAITQQQRRQPRPPSARRGGAAPRAVVCMTMH